MHPIEALKSEYEWFIYPGVPGALRYDPGWLEPFLASCEKLGIAAVGFSWFRKAGNAINPSGKVVDASASIGSTFREYQFNAHEVVRHGLNALPPDTGLVVFELAMPDDWLKLQVNAQRWVHRMDPDMTAKFDGKQVVISSTVISAAQPPLRVPKESNLKWWLVLGLFLLFVACVAYKTFTQP